MFKRFGLFLCLACSTAVVASCGGGDIGGGIGEFTTVSATVAPKTLRLESDILTGNTCSSTASTGGTIQTDNVDVDFTSKALFTSGTLNLNISKVTIHYTAIHPGTAPAIPDSYMNINQLVAPGSTVTISVPVLTRDQKAVLLTTANPVMPVCGLTMFEYYVDIIFEVSEPGGSSSTRYITARMNLDVADSI